MKILTFTTLYPNEQQPGHGIFVHQRIRRVAAQDRVEVKVVAPVPMFPLRHRMFGKYASYAKVARHEQRDGIEVFHPRFPVLPKVGMTLAPFLLSRATHRFLKEMAQTGYAYELIDAHYFYPDGVAAVALGKRIGVPVVITARGSDLHQIADFPGPRKMILSAARNAAGVITVCNALKEKLVDMGVDGNRVTVLRNGVDLDAFTPLDRSEAATSLGLKGRTLLSVGRLIELKGHDIPIRALAHLPATYLLIVGEGEEESNLKRIAKSAGVADRVRFVGRVDQQDLRRYYSAVDALVLASSREGWANVLLESMACGTPVIATNVWGTPEVVTAGAAGVLMLERTPEGFIAAYHQLFDDYPSRCSTRRYAEQFSWDDTTSGQVDVFSKALSHAQ